MFWNDTYLCCRIALVQGCLHLERNGEIMQTKMQKMKVWERHKLQVAACQKKHLKHAVLQKTKKEMEKHAKKCKSDQGPTGQTWVRKKYTKAPKKKQSRKNANQTRQTWFWKNKCKNLGLKLKCRKNANCTFAIAFCLHFFALCFCTRCFFCIFDLVHVFLSFFHIFSRLQFSRRIPQGANTNIILYNII